MKKTVNNNTLTVFLEGRIDSVNAPDVEKEILEALSENPESAVILDADALDYISSAGLRVLMKIKKTAKASVAIINVTPDVYEIFDTTGFTHLMDVSKKIREISVEGLEIIGQGATAKVYRIDADTIVKLYNANSSLTLVKQENERSKKAFLNGISTAISYDIVRSGDCYGTVYEMLNAKDFLSVVENDREHLTDHIKAFAAKMREMNSIEVDPRDFNPTKQASIEALPMLKGICTDEELAKFAKLYESVPDRYTFIHGDSHLGNVMLSGDDIMFIDLMTAGCGHPIFEMGSMCSVYHLPPKFGSYKDSPLTRNFSAEERKLIWETYLSSYLQSDDEAFLKKAERQIAAVQSARTLFAAVFIPGIIKPEKIDEIKNTAISYVDAGIETIDF